MDGKKDEKEGKNLNHLLWSPDFGGKYGNYFAPNVLIVGNNKVWRELNKFILTKV